jgi:ribosome maturation protein Sdo1
VSDHRNIKGIQKVLFICAIETQTIIIRTNINVSPPYLMPETIMSQASFTVRIEAELLLNASKQAQIVTKIHQIIILKGTLIQTIMFQCVTDSY